MLNWQTFMLSCGHFCLLEDNDLSKATVLNRDVFEMYSTCIQLT